MSSSKTFEVSADDLIAITPEMAQAFEAITEDPLDPVLCPEIREMAARVCRAKGETLTTAVAGAVKAAGRKVREKNINLFPPGIMGEMEADWARSVDNFKRYPLMPFPTDGEVKVIFQAIANRLERLYRILVDKSLTVLWGYENLVASYERDVSKREMTDEVKRDKVRWLEVIRDDLIAIPETIQVQGEGMKNSIMMMLYGNLQGKELDFFTEVFQIGQFRFDFVKIMSEFSRYRYLFDKCDNLIDALWAKLHFQIPRIIDLNHDGGLRQQIQEDSEDFAREIGFTFGLSPATLYVHTSLREISSCHAYNVDPDIPIKINLDRSGSSVGDIFSSTENLLKTMSGNPGKFFKVPLSSVDFAVRITFEDIEDPDREGNIGRKVDKIMKGVWQYDHHLSKFPATYNFSFKFNIHLWCEESGNFEDSYYSHEDVPGFADYFRQFATHLHEMILDYCSGGGDLDQEKYQKVIRMIQFTNVYHPEGGGGKGFVQETYEGAVEECDLINPGLGGRASRIKESEKISSFLNIRVDGAGRGRLEATAKLQFAVLDESGSKAIGAVQLLDTSPEGKITFDPIPIKIGRVAEEVETYRLIRGLQFVLRTYFQQIQDLMIYKNLIDREAFQVVSG